MTRIVKILETIWYRREKPPNLLIGFSMIYSFLLKIKRSLYDLGFFSTNKPSVPVIIIGNINIGGTGKTPVTLHLANSLSRLGKRVGIVSRGYKGRKSNINVEKIKSLKDEGLGATASAKTLGIHRDSVYRLLKRVEV